MTTFLIILIVFAIVAIAASVSASREQKNNQLVMKAHGYFVSQSIKSGKYLSGHPYLNKPIEKTEIYSGEKSLDIFDTSTLTHVRVASIFKSSIVNVLIEDQTTIEKRVTVSRLLLTGIFAFALKKKHVNELAYLIIEWNDERFKHETIFEFQNNGAMASANTARNQIIQALK